MTSFKNLIKKELLFVEYSTIRCNLHTELRGSGLPDLSVTSSVSPQGCVLSTVHIT